MERALQLLQQGSYILAERELRRVLNETPDHALPHALLAVCLQHLPGREREALAEAQQAVGLAPDLEFGHYALALSYLGIDESKPAEAAIREAIRLDPDDARYYALLSAIHQREHRWQDALEAAETGLRCDPEHLESRNFRARALMKLGRDAEAGDGLSEALADDPEDSFTHANLGWTTLEQGQHGQAYEHFREALRLDPDSEFAREGVIEAMKARNRLYRLFLKYLFWISRLQRRTAWLLIVGLFVLQRFATSLSARHPGLSPWLDPILYAYMLFALSTWLTSPSFNLLLCLDRFGRLALSDQERRDAVWFGVALAVGLGGFIAWKVNGLFFWFQLCAFGLFMALCLAGLQKQPTPEKRRVLVVYTVALLTIGLGMVGLAAVGSLWTDAAFTTLVFGTIGYEAMVIFVL